MERVEVILSELIRIDTTNPPGNEKAAAEYLAALFRRYGIPHRIVEAAPGRASFIARLGEGSRRLLFLSHTDVVPAGSGWDFPPFGGEIRDGFVLGRGALDNKNLVAAEAHTLIRLAAEKRKLNGTLIFVAAADEEAGGRFGMQYLVENFPQEICRLSRMIGIRVWNRPCRKGGGVLAGQGFWGFGGKGAVRRGAFLEARWSGKEDGGGFRE